MKKNIFLSILPAILIAPLFSQAAAAGLAERLAGRILLRVESKGEAYYVSPADRKRYYLGRPDDAFAAMRALGVGITDADLKKIPVGIAAYDDADNDNDGLSNRLEDALGTDPLSPDTDSDGYPDKTEVENNFDPAGAGALPPDPDFARRQAGRIFLAVEKKGEAYYVNPVDNKRYYLGRPADAFLVMRSSGLGVTDEVLNEIPTGQISQPPASLPPIKPAPAIPAPAPACPSCQSAKTNPDAVLSAAAAAIRTGQTEAAADYFSDDLGKLIQYTMDYLDSNGEFWLGNLMAGARRQSATDTEVIYETKAYFALGGYDVPMRFIVAKQADGDWKLVNL